jgi:hypothetical protein
LALPRKVSAKKAALAGWLRERSTVSLRWLSARLAMGHYTNGGRGPRKISPGGLRQFQQARAKLALLENKETK